MDLGGPGRDDDLVRLHMKHPVVGPGDDHRPGVDRHDLVARFGIEDEDASAGGSSRLGCRQSARSAADDRDIDRGATEFRDGRDRRHRRVGAHHDRQRRVVRGRVTDDGQSRPGRDLAGPDVGHPIDDREAVAAIAGETQRPAPTRHLPAPDDRHRDGVAGLEAHGLPVDDDPARVDRRPSRSIGHWRIRSPAGSNSGSRWMRAGRRRPMISISNAPSAPSAASAAGMYPSAIEAFT